MSRARSTSAAAVQATSTDLLLATKLYIPPLRPRMVARPRLLARLDHGLACRFTLVSGPAGFGKTTLLSEWVHALSSSPVPGRGGGGARGEEERAVSAAWLSLDQADNNPTRFWTYLIAALQTVRKGLGATALAALQSPQPPGMEALLTGLINDIATLGAGPLVLVLDDFHLITTPSIQEALLSLLDHLPPEMHLFLSGRADPPWPLARLRAAGEMVEVRTEDLRFTPTEVASFLNGVMRLDLAADDIAALDERTEGWIVGLQMAALSIQGRQDVPAFIQAFRGSHRFILDYLVEEVLDRQTPDIQSFLHQTAVLDLLTAPLCDAVTGRQDSQAVLTQLERTNLFLVPLDDERRWYRYHHLFADLLRSRLERSQPDQVTALHRRASAWYEEQQMLVEAVTHALAGHDPGEFVRSRPWLSIARAWALAYTGSFEAVNPCLQDAIQTLGGEKELALSCGLAPGEVAHIRGHIDAIRCYVQSITYEDPRVAIELAQSALAQLPESDWRARGRVAVLLGLGYRKSLAYAEAHAALSKALAIARAAEQKFVVVDVLCQIARVEADQGRLHQAAATCREALRLAEEYGGPGRSRLPVVSYALVTLSRILYEWNDLPTALELAQEALILARQWGQMDSMAGGYISLIMAQFAGREFDRALESVEEMKRIYRPGLYPRQSVAMEARVRLEMNDVAGAARCAAELVPYADEEWRMSRLISVYVTEFQQGVRSSLDDVLDFLTRTLPVLEAAGTEAGVVELLALQAVALQALGRVEEARSVLTRALSIAEPEGWIRTFIDEGALMGELLRAVLTAQRTQRGAAAQRIAGYASRLLSAMGVEMPGAKPSAPSSADLVEPLSEREFEILRLLATSLSTPEIARELILSANTVRSHVKSIYGKLNVHGRIEAIQRARELRLLS